MSTTFSISIPDWNCKPLRIFGLLLHEASICVSWWLSRRSYAKRGTSLYTHTFKYYIWSSLTLDSLRHLYNTILILADIFSFGHKKKLKMIELIMLWFNSQQQAENLTTNLSYEDVTGYICRTYHRNSRIPVNSLLIIVSWEWSPIRRYHILKCEDFVMEKVKEIEYPLTW